MNEQIHHLHKNCHMQFSQALFLSSIHHSKQKYYFGLDHIELSKKLIEKEITVYFAELT